MMNFPDTVVFQNDLLPLVPGPVKKPCGEFTMDEIASKLTRE
jgi:hypothetical protein